jgi:hypothetical protein
MQSKRSSSGSSKAGHSRKAGRSRKVGRGTSRDRTAATQSNARNARPPVDSLPARGAPLRTGPPLPTSGSEDVFNEGVYGTPRGKGNNNCYGWAIDEYRNSGESKLQPGNLGREPGRFELRSCEQLNARVLADMRGRAYVEDAQVPCKRGYYKIMGFLDPDDDYHWYKQHRHALVQLSGRLRSVAGVARVMGVSPKQVYSPSPRPRTGDTLLVKDAGVWSHKQGFATGPLLKDACDQVIKDPRQACRAYGNLNYTRYCGSLCVMSQGRNRNRQDRQKLLRGRQNQRARREPGISNKT